MGGGIWTADNCSLATGKGDCYGANQFIWSNFKDGGYMNSLTDGRARVSGSIPTEGTYDFCFSITAPRNTVRL